MIKPLRAVIMRAKSATDPNCKISKIVTRAFITLLSQLRNSTATSESTPCCDKGTSTSTSASATWNMAPIFRTSAN